MFCNNYILQMALYLELLFVTCDVVTYVTFNELFWKHWGCYNEEVCPRTQLNSLGPDGTKTLPEPMLTNHQWGLMAFHLRAIPQEMLNISIFDIDGLVQERPNSIANTLELRLSFTSPLIWVWQWLILKLQQYPPVVNELSWVLEGFHIYCDAL